jgi:hypothetical protein
MKIDAASYIMPNETYLIRIACLCLYQPPPGQEPYSDNNPSQQRLMEKDKQHSNRHSPIHKTKFSPLRTNRNKSINHPD